MSVYSNSINLHLNEVAIIEFREQTQMGNGVVASVAMTYEAFKMLHETMANAIEQHDKKLHELKRSKENMN
jgi:hypothetical protein